MMKNPFDTGIRMTVVRDPTRTTCSVDEFVLCPTNARADAAIQRAERAEHARDEAVREAIWRIENETRAAGERDKARAEVARLRGLVAAITNLITNPASIEHGLVMTDEISEPFAEGDAEQRSSQTCARPKCSDPATVVTGLCVAHSVSAMGDSIDRTVERKRRKT
jgi:hypothetical protein